MDTASTERNLRYLRTPPADLLVLGCSVYLLGKPKTFLNYMEEGFAVFEVWCKQHPGWAKSRELQYFNPEFSACLCGQTWQQRMFNTLHHHCPQCQGRQKKLISPYEIQRIAMYLELPDCVIEQAMCEAIRIHHVRKYILSSEAA